MHKVDTRPDRTSCSVRGDITVLMIKLVGYRLSQVPDETDLVENAEFRSLLGRDLFSSVLRVSVYRVFHSCSTK